MQVKRILSALLLVLVAWLQVGLPAIAATGVAGRVQVTDNTEAVYRASTGVFTTATTATDIFNFKGSSTKTIYIRKIVWKQANLATTGSHQVYLLKRSTANSGGTTVALTLIPLDSNAAAATASGVHYTANASSLGTSLGTIRHAWVFSNTANASFNASEYVMHDSATAGAPIVLRGTSESVSVSYNAVTDPIGTSACIDIEWSEK